jgi:hypothetical protein
MSLNLHWLFRHTGQFSGGAPAWMVKLQPLHFQ